MAEGYERGGKTPTYLKKGEQPNADIPVVIFTNSKMQQDLDEQKPDWRARGWTIIHNPKETIDAGRYARIIAKERGTPLPDG